MFFRFWFTRLPKVEIAHLHIELKTKQQSQKAQWPSPVPLDPRLKSAVKAAIVICLLVCCSGCTMVLSAISTKYNDTNYEVRDSETNRELVRACMGATAQQFGLQETPEIRVATNNYFARVKLPDHPKSEGWRLEAYVTAGVVGFLWPEFVNFEAFAKKLKDAAPSDEVSRYFVSRFRSTTQEMLSAYSGGPDPALQRAMTEDMYGVTGSTLTPPQDGSIYESNRFAHTKLSPETLTLLSLDHKVSLDVVQLNRMLVEDAYTQEISRRPMTKTIVVCLGQINRSGKRAKVLVAIDDALTRKLTNTFGSEIRIARVRGWIP
jgi:hypothetical protein